MEKEDVNMERAKIYETLSRASHCMILDLLSIGLHHSEL